MGGQAQVVVTDETVIEKRGRARRLGGRSGPPGRRTHPGRVRDGRAACGPQGILWPFSGLPDQTGRRTWVINQTLVRVTPDTTISAYRARLAGLGHRRTAARCAGTASHHHRSDCRRPERSAGGVKASWKLWSLNGASRADVPAKSDVVSSVNPSSASRSRCGPSSSRRFAGGPSHPCGGHLGGCPAQRPGRGHCASPGEQVWDLIVFPPSEYAEPVIGTARQRQHPGGREPPWHNRASGSRCRASRLARTSIRPMSCAWTSLCRLRFPASCAPPATAWWTIDGMPAGWAVPVTGPPGGSGEGD